MGRFDHLATRPARGPRDLLRWKLLDRLSGRTTKDPGGFVTPSRSHDRALVESGAAQLTWLGHASFLLTLGGRHMLGAPGGLAFDAGEGDPPNSFRPSTRHDYPLLKLRQSLPC